MPSRLTDNLHAPLNDDRRFGNVLRAAREHAGLTQIELADRTGYTNGWISNVERGAGVPTATFVSRCERILGANLGYSSMVMRPRKGDVGAWGMTATEASGYVGLSRTRIYEMMRKDQLAFVLVDGYRRVRITDLADWVVQDARSRGMGVISGEEEGAKIRDWLKSRRGYDVNETEDTSNENHEGDPE